MTAFSAVRPSAIKLKSAVRFPARVEGGTAISAEKENGVYTIGLDYSGLQQTDTFDPDVAEIAIWNPETDVWNRTSLTEFVNESVAAPTFDSIAPTSARGDLIFRDATTNTRLGAGTAGYHLQTNGAGADPTWAGFLQSGTGATTRTWQDKARDIVSVKDFGAVGDGSTDDTAAITAADTAAYLAGKAVFFPGGTYKVSSAITPAASAVWFGEGYNQTFLSTSSGTADMIAVSNQNFTMRDIGLKASVTRTAGAYVKITGNGIVHLDGLYLTGAFHGVDVNHSSAILYISNSFFADTVASTGVSIQIDNVNIATFISIVGNNSPAAKPYAHINVVANGNISCFDCQLLQATYDLSITPSAPGPTLFKATNSYFDTAGTYGVNVAPTSTGTVTHLSFDQCWFSSAGSAGVFLSATGSASITGISFIDPQIYDGVYGFYINGSGVKDVRIIGGEIAGCSSTAINLVDADHGIISNMTIGPVGTATNANGIVLSGSADYWNIHGNDVTGNTTTNISISGTSGTHNQISNNVGYNPVGGAAVTTGASPWSYTAGPSPETLYMSASTSITGITQGGVGLPIAQPANALVTINLSPNETVSSITYTGTLTAKKVIH